MLDRCSSYLTIFPLCLTALLLSAPTPVVAQTPPRQPLAALAAAALHDGKPAVLDNGAAESYEFRARDIHGMLFRVVEHTGERDSVRHTVEVYELSPETYLIFNYRTTTEVWGFKTTTSGVLLRVLHRDLVVMGAAPTVVDNAEGQTLFGIEKLYWARWLAAR